MTSWALIGHRGVGKSTLLYELKKHFPEYQCLSLDELIEQSEKKSIKEIFKSGEEDFRSIENSVFSQTLLSIGDRPFIIDLGAGFTGEIPSSIKCLWVKRGSHSDQVMFPNRPNLDGSLKMSPQRYQQREACYKQRADVAIELREGPRFFNKGELIFFEALFRKKKGSWLSHGYYTLSKTTTETEKELLLNLGIKGFEYRDDWTDEKPNDPSKDLLSLRTRGKNKNWAGLIDWPFEWGDNSEASILSYHSRKESLDETLQELPKTKAVLKLAVSVKNFKELMQGHQWMMQNPKGRSFLPMSNDGRWGWYRLLTSSKAPIQFFRLGEGSAADQPSVLQVLNHPTKVNTFAAVLGDPVQHSWSPTFHQDYFSKKKVPFYTLRIAEEEFVDAMRVLEKLGLCWAAVTAPLKETTAAWLGRTEPVNTLCLSDQGWQGTSTDIDGLKTLIGDTRSEPVAVWGGGGTHATIEKLLPQAQYYSSRTGELKKGLKNGTPTQVIWAVGAQAFRKKGVFPPSDWPLQRVFDLNYSSDSPGIECAWNFGCQYTSGMVMFEAQALKQQEFWNECRVK